MRPFEWTTGDGRKVLLSQMHPEHLAHVIARMKKHRLWRENFRKYVDAEIEARKIVGPPYGVDRNP